MTNSISVFFCGFGRRAREHATALEAARSFRLCGAYDPAVSARDQAAQAGIPVFGDLTEGLAASRPELVLIATPPAERLTLVCAVVARARPRILVVEKPLALTAGEARALAGLCERAGVALHVGHQLPWTSEFSALLDHVRDGHVGTVRQIFAGCFGKLFDQGSHLVDLIGRLLPSDEPIWVAGGGRDNLSELSRFRPLPAGFAPDAAHPGFLWTSASIRTRAGVDIKLDCGLLDACPVPELGPWLQKRIVVIGTRGMAEAQSGSHFFAAAEGASPVRRNTSVAEYGQALTRFYIDLARNRHSDLGAQPADLSRDIAVVTLIEAIQQAAGEGTMVNVAEFASAPEPAVAGAPAASTVQEPAGVSVIIPMDDHRGMALDALRSWTSGQRCPPDRYEVIVLLDRNTSELEPVLRPQLRPQDRLVSRDDAHNEMELYHHGAVLARRPILLFTEPHCLAEPQAIAETEAFFTCGAADGFCIRSTPIAANAIARLEARMYEDGFQEWSRPEHWGKVILRGFGISRDLYLKMGGFQYRFDRFAEWLLAAEMKQRGIALRYAPGVGVAHLYSDRFSLLDRFIREFTDGECAYRLEHGDTPSCVEFFGDPPEWQEAMRFSAEFHRATMRAALAGMAVWGGRGGLSNVGANLAAFLLHLPPAVFGRRWLRWRYWRQARCARLAAWNPFAPEDRRYSHFTRYWDRTTALCRVDFATEKASGTTSAWNGEPIGTDGPLSSAFQGFYPVEHFEGQAFRWTAPVFGIRIAPGFPGGTIELALRPFRGEGLPTPSAFACWSGKAERLPVQVNREKTRKSVDCPAAAKGGAWIVFISREFGEAKRLGGETRTLGVPVSTIRLT